MFCCLLNSNFLLTFDTSNTHHKFPDDSCSLFVRSTKVIVLRGDSSFCDYLLVKPFDATGFWNSKICDCEIDCGSIWLISWSVDHSNQDLCISDLFRLQLFLFHLLRVAETLLQGSKFHRYIRDGLSQVRSSAPYSVPDDVHKHLDFGESLSLAVNIHQPAVTYCCIVIVGMKFLLFLCLRSWRTSSPPSERATECQ